MIFEDKVDVLMDIGLWTAGNRMEVGLKSLIFQVFALKPAPIQIGAMGFASTTGGEW